ncbi:hypothetical protein FA13DRAFT_1796875 [Coprinellus micaceus]|uniref:peptidylprolyl isomerase n=1 Tax=Coprinellus micaceus TaxID=71717 RepID=A0A4Y7SSL4_COPMI|nr:hypothetical protein FA13DRAFT_1796875 [Coprinellus micaceus]
MSPASMGSEGRYHRALACFAHTSTNATTSGNALIPLRWNDLLAISVVFTLADETVPKKPKKLRIETLYEPAHCHKKNARKSRKGDELNVVYSGAFYTDPDTVFDTNIGKPDPLKFTLGVGKVMPGWEQGMTKMCIGERRKLIIPGDLTFNGEPAIYQVELKGLKRKAPSPGKSEL